MRSTSYVLWEGKSIGDTGVLIINTILLLLDHFIDLISNCVQYLCVVIITPTKYVYHLTGCVLRLAFHGRGNLSEILVCLISLRGNSHHDKVYLSPPRLCLTSYALGR